jgi:hypothetical protein
LSSRAASKAAPAWDALAAGCSQLRQLTLRGISPLSEQVLAALMAGLPQLRLLRLLGCAPELSQEHCQALVGRLRLWGCRWTRLWTMGRRVRTGRFGS